MAAMMPLVSHAPRPQMNSSSSREVKNGGTVSMWVESVTVSGSPNCANTLARRGSTSIASTVPPNRSASGSRYSYRKLPDPLLVVGDGFDIDQLPREFEKIHISKPVGSLISRLSRSAYTRQENHKQGRQRERHAARTADVLFPIALHPVCAGSLHSKTGDSEPDFSRTPQPEGNALSIPASAEQPSAPFSGLPKRIRNAARLLMAAAPLPRNFSITRAAASYPCIQPVSRDPHGPGGGEL